MSEKDDIFRKSSVTPFDKFAPLIALAIGGVSFFSTIGKSGIWDPFELGVADLARRVAVNNYGAKNLVLQGGDNSLPHLVDLGRGELPFDSMALGFRVFGLHEWAGRLPLGMWALAGLGAMYWFLSRMVDRRGALYGAIILATMPLYFIQARTMLGDITTMASIAIAFAGLGVGVFDRPDRGWSGRAISAGAPSGAVAGGGRSRLIAFGIGIVGCVAGFMCRGALIGIAIPALAIGLTWLIDRLANPPQTDRLTDRLGAVALLVGFVATLVGIRALHQATTNEYSIPLGAAVIASTPKFPTFDLVIHYLGHSLFPWSAFIPFAVGRLFRPAPSSPDETASTTLTKESQARVALLVGSCLAYGVYSLLAPKTGYLTFGAPALLAGVAAIAIRDFERGAPPSRAIAVGVALFTLLFLRDFAMFPEKGLSVFAPVNAIFPESFKDQAGHVILASSFVFIFLVFFAWLERDRDQNRPFQRDDYLAWPRSLRSAFDGNLAYVLVMVEIALLGIAGAISIGIRVLHSKPMMGLAEPIRVVGLNGFWVAPVALFAIVWGTMAVRDVFRWVFVRTGISRAFVTIVAGAVSGGLLSFVYYPALAEQLSPKEVFESYGHLHHAGEPLGLLGVAGKSANYYAGGDAKVLSDVGGAFNWLSDPTQRRWLVLRNDDLPKLNSQFRRGPGDRRNLPVLDARSSQILLASNRLGPGEFNSNPFESMVLNEAPKPSNRSDVNLQDQLEVLGWDIADASGKIGVEALVPGRKFHFRIYFKVIAAVSSEWEIFIHIDGAQRRYNGDHKALGGKYPMAMWQVGDFIVDDNVITLEPNFTSGSYSVYFGLFVGENRMKVKSGRQNDNRVEGGTIQVR